MSMHRKTITLTEQQAKKRLAMLRQVLAEGEASGEPKPLDISAIKPTARGEAYQGVFSAQSR